MTDNQGQTSIRQESVPPDIGTAESGGGGRTDRSGGSIRRRRPPSAAEQARRKAWGHEWGSVGHWWKVTHPDERR